MNASVTSSQKLVRSIGRRVEEDNDANDSDGNPMSQSSDSIKDIDWTPFEMDFDMTETEILGLFDAFSRYMDPKDNKISFNELFHDLKKIKIQGKNPLLYEILGRILEFPEIQGEDDKDKRIDFDTFKKLLTKSLNMRQTRQ